METLDKFDVAILVQLQTDARQTNAELAFVRLDADHNSLEATGKLEEAIKKMPEVVACDYISGTGTYELQVVAQDLETFSQFALKKLMNLPHVKDIHTSFSLGEVKASGVLPLGHLGR